jgi:hypothetical protein
MTSLEARDSFPTFPFVLVIVIVLVLVIVLACQGPGTKPPPVGVW